MAKNKKKFLIGTLLLVGLGSVAVLVLKCNSRDRVENSIEELLEKKVHLKYQITKKSIDASLTDASGEWAVRLDSDELPLKSLDAGFVVADDYDLNYFMGRLVEKSILIKGPKKYLLYRSELVLGENTICETRSCNIYILHNEGGREMYVGIYSN